jgi:AcrR family transcriptional regulator
MNKISLKDQQLKLKEDIILSAVNQLLAQKGYDAMTVDSVAAQVGMAKPSLYKMFPSKESLAAAALIRLLDQALETAHAQQAEARPIDKLRAVLRWALELHLAGSMPLLPSTRSSLRDALMNNPAYVDRLQSLSSLLLEWIEAAQRAGQIDAALPPAVVLYTLYASTCDPVLDFLRDSGEFDGEHMIALVLGTCFDGLRCRD